MNKSRDEVTFNLDDVECIVCESKMIWSDETRDWVCPKCGNRAFQDQSCGPDEIYYEHGPDDDYDEVYEETYDMDDLSPDKDGF